MPYTLTICPICQATDAFFHEEGPGGTQHAVCAQCVLDVPEYVVTYEAIDEDRELEESFTSFAEAVQFARRIIEDGGHATLADQYGEFDIP